MSSIYKEVNGISLRKIPKSARKVVAAGHNGISSTLTLPQTIKTLMEVEIGDRMEFWHIPGTKLMVIAKVEAADGALIADDNIGKSSVVINPKNRRILE